VVSGLHRAHHRLFDQLFAGVNLFEAHIANALLGRILSGILVGGGSSLIHDALDRPEGEVIELQAEFPAVE
jgi:hypothetical protein